MRPDVTKLDREPGTFLCAIIRYLCMHVFLDHKLWRVIKANGQTAL